MSSSAYVKLYFHRVKMYGGPVYFFFLSAMHFGQNHFPFGFVVNPTQAKWNHSIGHWKRKYNSQKEKVLLYLFMCQTHLFTTETFVLIFNIVVHNIHYYVYGSVSSWMLSPAHSCTARYWPAISPAVWYSLLCECGTMCPSQASIDA